MMLVVSMYSPVIGKSRIYGKFCEQLKMIFNLVRTSETSWNHSQCDLGGSQEACDACACLSVSENPT